MQTDTSDRGFAGFSAWMYSDYTTNQCSFPDFCIATKYFISEIMLSMTAGYTSFIPVPLLAWNDIFGILRALR